MIKRISFAHKLLHRRSTSFFLLLPLQKKVGEVYPFYHVYPTHLVILTIEHKMFQMNAIPKHIKAKRRVFALKM